MFISHKNLIRVLYFQQNMLTPQISQEINNAVAQGPKTIQEIAQLIDKNWRTAQGYVQRINVEQGTIATRTFREGTKGALKIVYWNQLNKNQTTFQEMLFHKIVHAKRKEDFSPFDIYQYIDDQKRTCFIEKQEKNGNIKQDLIATFASAQEQVLIFSGALSWSQTNQDQIPLLKGFQPAVQKNIPIKILANVDLNSMKNVQEMNSINHEIGKELIEIRHCQQPLRAFIIDQKSARIKEKYFLKKTSSENYLFYSITDQEWILWLQKVFWHFFSTSISAQKRLQDLQSIKQK